jgi:Terpene cyclase DEP1
MNGRQIGLSMVLAAFAGFEAYAVYEHGVVGIFTAVLANSATTVAFADLCIALGLVATWMAVDARDRGISVVPYLIVTLALGSVGPLLYLIRRESRSPVGAVGMARA